MKKFKEYINEMRPVEDRFKKVDSTILSIAETISRNTASNINAVLEWFETQYKNDKNKIFDMMTKYASSKRWMDIVTAVINNKPLK